jgi:molybdopterin-guanine dinucleotide biosynthesis protein A
MMKAVVVAGGRATPALAQEAGQSIKGLFRLNGGTCVQHVLDTLWAAGIEQIVLVGSELLLEGVQADSRHLIYVSEGKSVIENLMRGMRRLELTHDERFLQCAVDLPMVTSQSMSRFLNEAEPDCDVSIPLVLESRFRLRYPDCPYRAIDLQDGRYLFGSMTVLRAGFLIERQTFLEKLTRARKSVWRTMLALGKSLGLSLFYPGLPTAWRFARGQLNTRQLRHLALQVLHTKVQFQTESMPDLAFDIDTPEDYRCARFWAERLKSSGELAPR